MVLNLESGGISRLKVKQFVVTSATLGKGCLLLNSSSSVVRISLKKLARMILKY